MSFSSVAFVMLLAWLQDPPGPSPFPSFNPRDPAVAARLKKLQVEQRARADEIDRFRLRQRTAYEIVGGALDRWAIDRSAMIDPELTRMLAVATFTLTAANCVTRPGVTSLPGPDYCFPSSLTVRQNDIQAAVHAYMDSLLRPGKRRTFVALLAERLRLPLTRNLLTFSPPPITPIPATGVWAAEEPPLTRCFTPRRHVPRTATRIVCSSRRVTVVAQNGEARPAVFNNSSAAYSGTLTDSQSVSPTAALPPFARRCEVMADAPAPEPGQQSADPPYSPSWHHNPNVVEIELDASQVSQGAEAVLDELARALAMWVSLGPRGIWAMTAPNARGQLTYWVREDKLFDASNPSEASDHADLKNLPYWASQQDWNPLSPDGEYLHFVKLSDLPSALKGELASSGRQPLPLKLPRMKACPDVPGLVGCASPTSGVAIRGEVHANPTTRRLEVTSENGSAALEAVLLHELGHWFGLPHMTPRGANAGIMENVLRAPNHCITSTDTSGLFLAMNNNWRYRLKSCEGLRVKRRIGKGLR